MLLKLSNRIGLRRLILLLAVTSALIMLVNSLHASYRVQRQLLIDNTLEANRVYATKLAAITDVFFKTSLQQLSYSTSTIADRMDDSDRLNEEARRIGSQSGSFNTVSIVDEHGVVKATFPDRLQLMGKKVTTAGVRRALQEKSALISSPYFSVTDNLIVLVSAPIFTRDGRYKGFIGGSIHLEKPSILNALLERHYYRDGSYIYVTDHYRKILYHKDPTQIGVVVRNSPIIDSRTERNGSREMTDSQGRKALVGYAVVPANRWEVLVLRPISETLKPLDSLMLNVLQHTLPLAILTLFCVWLLARLIAQPLWLLARSANKMDSLNVSDDIRKIHSWYFEATQLKQAMLIGIELLQKKIGKLRYEAQTDPMTGLFNRRGLESILRYWLIGQKSFAIVALDIDHFKRVNDTYGHDAGDSVIKYLAQLIRSSSRDTDILCRSGGEEFLILLPETNMKTAVDIAERLRNTTQQATIPTVGKITISLGVSMWLPDTQEITIKRAFKMADKALYKAKQQGRNRVISAADAA
ncbi:MULTISPECIES: sensor domain-containing diguanylate cyclase [unclassified Brenneria]|uniref:sensor domain-containing diguanylate cyclase n=1 Tax=unclassified Brenneria TaxID=2634434 RepID=UPI001556D1B8|nr:MULTISPECIES: sensor domain-containing diguanylate cyclase [unclassified Brenneria]MBJ7222828.1 GGDEF domain-containing protein [Brenneria sp. L3-3C-1]MEE3644071.1 sensor domain-containing diguanylate cyclase [Brenneria sp. L3_3C_1]MEE3651827.1 sensor domain-containing diguanylate cyclase [Brenneria sp. HEZEL_4_2_4]NPD01786.1 GGDEF domain-containing protein [Brenneria sp. hezel4-2-4]